MQSERISVRRLSLTSASRRALQGVVPEIEDALRTASWPQAGGTGAVLMIRRLDLGRIARGATRHQIGKVITARLADLPLRWSRPDEDGCHAQVMAWPSRAACLAHVAVRMDRAGGQGGGAPWWVARALAGMSQASPDQRALTRAVGDLWQSAGPTGLCAVIARIAEAGAPARAATLLADLAVDIVAELSREAPGLIRAVAPEPGDPTRNTGQGGGEKAAGTPHPAMQALVSRMDTQTARLWQALASDPAIRGLPAARQAAIAILLLRARTAPVSFPGLARRLQSAMSTAVPRRPRHQTGPDGPTPRRARRIHEVPGRDDGPRARAPRPTPEATALTPAPERAPKTDLPAWPEADPTRAGGVIMLLNLITRLGLPQADARAGTDLSLRLLHRFTARLPDAAAMLAALPAHVDPDTEPDPGTTGWTAPPEVVAALRGQLSCRDDRLFVRQTALSLGLRPETMPETMPWTALPQTRGPRAPDLLGGLSLALQRAAFAATGRGWRVMAARAGYVSATETHIDVTLDLSDVRLAERMAGLDLSPGWLPWLGRVVTLHFEPFARVGGGDE